MFIRINVAVVMSQIFAENNVRDVCWILFERAKHSKWTILVVLDKILNEYK